MLKLGLIQKFNITNDGWKKPESYKQMVKGCHGTGSSLANRGAIWLALGLIKHHIKNAELNDGYNKSQDHLKKLVTIRQQDASAFNTEVRNILRLISEKGISVNNSDSITDEGDELSSHEQDELQTHLLRAFVYHLSVIQVSGINAPANLMNLSTLAKSKLVGLAKLTDVKSISDEGDFVYGVSHELALRGEDDVLSDGSWTSIPGTIVARWQSGFRPNMNIHEALSTGIRH
ncbi:hypothetical protein FOYG_11640 [Fusarium oxysporum NRRL 32931]|uniref:Uncharacterized protein n=1 Tax=Fusarium oxysporum NRRL 32931 TaxID=660029 RepID=W9I2H3_FUSOX|nr:hypothetical protein FOYG_11640 [Fusarium oxysporum NRRL 32931]